MDVDKNPGTFNGWFTYKSLPFRKENDLNETPP